MSAHDHARHGHHHDRHHHAVARQPTLSLLRLSAGERLAGAASILAVLWAATLWAMV